MPASDAAVDPAARQAVLEAAVPAKEKPTALVHQLQRYTVSAPTSTFSTTCRTPSEPVIDASVSCSLQVVHPSIRLAAQQRPRRPISSLLDILTQLTQQLSLMQPYFRLQYLS
jgi:hypothetical protein